MKTDVDRVRPSPPHIYAVGKEAFLTLSPREEQVLSYASAGYMDKQISAELKVSENTLRTYWARIRRKICDAPRSALATAYVQHLASNAEAEPAIPRSSGHSVPDVRLDGQPIPNIGNDLSPDWIIDLQRGTFMKVSSRRMLLESETGVERPLDELVKQIAPGDRECALSLIQGAKAGQITDFIFAANMITSAGLQHGRAVARVKRDSEGSPQLINGWSMLENKLPTNP